MWLQLARLYVRYSVCFINRTTYLDIAASNRKWRNVSRELEDFWLEPKECTYNAAAKDSHWRPNISSSCLITARNAYCYNVWPSCIFGCIWKKLHLVRSHAWRPVRLRQFQLGQTVEVLKSYVESEFGVPMTSQVGFKLATLYITINSSTARKLLLPVIQCIYICRSDLMK